jgi:hypothetical protein
MSLVANLLALTQEIGADIKSVLVSLSTKADKSALSVEVYRASIAEGELGDSISAEEARALDAEILLAADISTKASQAALATEVYRASIAEGNIADNLVDEVTNRTNAVNLKADLTYTNIQLGLKSDKTYVDNELNLKADITYVDDQVIELLESAPEALDTLNELAAALGNDENFATTTATSIGLKADKTNVLQLNNTTAYTPTQSYHPVTVDFLTNSSAGIQSPIVITDAVGPDQSTGQTYGSGSTIETIVRDMLVSYQVPDVTNITSPNPTTLEHGSSLSFASVSFNKSSDFNIDLGVDGTVVYTDPTSTNDVTEVFTHTASSSQSVGITVSDTVRVVSSNAGTSGTARYNNNYKLQVTGTNSKGNIFERTESWNIYFRTYFGASSTLFDGSNGATIISDLSNSLLENDSKRTVTCTSDNQDVTKATYFVMPTCHLDNMGLSIIQNGATPVAGAFIIAGIEVVNGVEYSFVKSSALGAFANGDVLVIS